MRRFSPPLSLSLSFIETFVFRFGNDNYRHLCRSSTFSAVIVPKLSEFRYPTLAGTIAEHETTVTKRRVQSWPSHQAARPAEVSIYEYHIRFVPGIKKVADVP